MTTIDDAFIKVYAKRPSSKVGTPASATHADQEDTSRKLATIPGGVELRVDRRHVSRMGAAASQIKAKRNNESKIAASSEKLGQTSDISIDAAESMAPMRHFSQVHVEVVGFDQVDATAYDAIVNDLTVDIPVANMTSLRDQEIRDLLAAVNRITRQELSTSEELKSRASENNEINEPTIAVETVATQLTQSPHAKERPNLSFQPVWEVDAFGWPSCIDQLDIHGGQVMKEAGVALRRASADGLRVLAVTSPGRGHGRTTIAIQLARAAARYGLRVALVDADTDRPVLADRLCVEVNRGWIEAAGEGLPLEEAAIYSISDGITLLPLVPWNGGSTKLREQSPKIQEIFAQLSRDHDLVVVDCGHLGALGTLFHASQGRSIDAALLVCDQRITSEETREAGVARLNRLGIKQIGIVENFVEHLGSVGV